MAFKATELQYLFADIIIIIIIVIIIINYEMSHSCLYSTNYSYVSFSHNISFLRMDPYWPSPTSAK